MPVYIITHKLYNRFTDCISYKNVQVGACKGHLPGMDYYDDGGENISVKNPNYCELTGLYWIWKNRLEKDQANGDYIGLVHYRRYFSRHYGREALSDSEIRKLLGKGDIILPFNNVDPRTVRAMYCEHSGFQEDLDRVRKILTDKYPDYVADYDSFMEGHDNYFFNMFISRPELANRYCRWLFDILFALEPLVDLDSYNSYQKRIYGFLSERLLNVWVRHNHLKVVETGVINTEEREKPVREVMIAFKRTLCSGRVHQY
jgi:hypothetical protein